MSLDGADPRRHDERVIPVAAAAALAIATSVVPAPAPASSVDPGFVESRHVAAVSCDAGMNDFGERRSGWAYAFMYRYDDGSYLANVTWQGFGGDRTKIELAGRFESDADASEPFSRTDQALNRPTTLHVRAATDPDSVRIPMTITWPSGATCTLPDLAWSDGDPDWGG
jgi:hypothetical protein